MIDRIVWRCGVAAFVIVGCEGGAVMRGAGVEMEMGGAGGLAARGDAGGSSLGGSSGQPERGMGRADVDGSSIQDASGIESSANDDAGDEDLGWAAGQGDAAWSQCAEIAPLDVATFADAKAAPGTAFRMKVRVKHAPEAAVPSWLWQITRMVPEPVTALTPTALDAGWTTVSFPLAAPGTYRVVVHSHYPVMDACAADLLFDAQ